MNQKEEQFLSLKELLLKRSEVYSSGTFQKETPKHQFKLFQIYHTLSSEFKIADWSSYNLTTDQKNLKIDRLKNAYFKGFGIDPNDLSQIQALKEFLKSVPKTKELVKFLFDKQESNVEETLFDKQDSHVEELNKKEDPLFDLFKDQIKIYGYFKEEEYESFKKIYKVLQYIAQVVEKNNNGDEVAQRAYKLMVLFGKEPEQGLKSLDTFIKKFAAHLQKPVHDILIHDIPKQEEKIDFPAWKKLLNRYGLKLLKNLVLAKGIEQALGGKVPKNLQEMNGVLPQLIYEKFSENPDFARLFHHYNVSEGIFERTLKFIKDGTLRIKTSDNLPSVVVDLEKEVDPDYKGYYLVKLPAGDPRGLILGKITNCCQSIGGHSEVCVIDGMRLENNGFYVLIKANDKNFDPNNIDWIHFEEHENQVRGQGYVWVSEGGVGIDSWENLGPSDDEKIIKSLPVFAKKIMEKDSNIARVTIGLGGKTPKECSKILETPYPEQPLQGRIYGDSKRQVEVAANEILEEYRTEYRIKYDWISPECLVSLKQIEAIEHLSKESIEFLKNLEESIRKELLHPIIVTNGNFLNTLFDLIKKNKEDIRVSSQAIHAYGTEKFSMEDLIKDLDGIQDFEILKVLISKDARSAYELGLPFQDLKDIKDFEILKVLISEDARSAYKLGLPFQDLKDIKDFEILKVLISDGARSAYEQGLPFQDLKDIKDFEILKVLISNGARSAYKQRLPFQDLKDIKDIQIIRHFISVYSNGSMLTRGGVLFQELKDVKDIKILELLTRENVIGGCLFDEVFSFRDLKDIIKDPEIFELLTAPKMIRLYRSELVSFQDLKDKDPEIIKLLVSELAVLGYELGKISVQSLKDRDSETIKLLISEPALLGYELGKISVQGLRDKDPETINLLSDQQLVKDSEIIIMLFLSQRNVLEGYARGEFSVQDLMDVKNLELIELLFSFPANVACECGEFSFQDLKDIKDPEIINLLISVEAAGIYEKKILSFQDLKAIKDPKSIKLLISYSDELFSYKDKILLIGHSLHVEYKKHLWFSLNNKLLNEQEIRSIQDLSRGIGENLFGKIDDSNVNNVVRIEMSLLESINNIKCETKEGIFNINHLKPDCVIPFLEEVLKTVSLDKLFDPSNSNTPVFFTENSSLKLFKESLKDIVKKVILVDSSQQKRLEIDMKI